MQSKLKRELETRSHHDSRGLETAGITHTVSRVTYHALNVHVAQIYEGSRTILTHVLKLLIKSHDAWL
ncbi:hypothetical protein PUN28_001661 [Cardiocondyla obscurior]|uniref:Acyl-CoA dehydrogenase/oxidase C-terminal domain-containing protein n=1 Tax=Cardiocondyla obscurior TaxID=286306 RepID=A0AAW2GQP3_9HYME